MKILITGGAGFIGCNIVEYLFKHYPESEIKVIDNLITGRIENIAPFMERSEFEFIEDTVTNKKAMEPLIEWCDHCYHLAAPVGVKLIMDRPVHSVLDNIRGIDTVMEFVHKYGKRVLVASTSETYGKSLDMLDPTHTRKLKEEDYRVEGSTRNHRWAYANTKSLDEFLAFAYHKEYGTEVVVARFFNTVGPKQLSNYGMVIPNFVQQALAGKEVRVFGTGKQLRSFMHVNDAVRAVVALMMTGKGIGEEFNIGNPFEISMNDLAQKIIDKTHSTAKITHISYEEAYGKGFEDMDRRTADITKLCTTLDFELEYDLEGILADIISFHRTAMKA